MLSTIRTEVKANVKNSVISDSRIDLWANLSQEEIWRHLDPEFGKETATFTTSSSVRLYHFDASLCKILSVVDQTNDLPLTQISETEVEAFDPDLNESGSPTFYSLYGLSYISNQPTAASTISIVSSDNTDTTQTVQVVGTVGGQEDADTVTLTGIVPAVTSKSFTALRRISKSAVTEGIITATSNAGAVTNVSISSRKLFREMQPIRLWPIPDASLTILVRFIRNPVPMRDAYDTPDLPELWHSILLKLTTAHAHDFVYEFDRAQQLRNLVMNDMEKMKQAQTHKRGYAPVVGEGFSFKGIGRLPSNFPRG